MPRKIKVGDFVSRCKSRIRLNLMNDVGIVTLLCANETQVEVKWNSDDIASTENKIELNIISVRMTNKERCKTLRLKKKIDKNIVKKTGVAKIRKSIAAVNFVGISAVIPMTIAATPQDAGTTDKKRVRKPLRQKKQGASNDPVVTETNHVEVIPDIIAATPQDAGTTAINRDAKAFEVVGIFIL